MYKKIDDIIDSPDIDPSRKIDPSPALDSLRKTVDEINKKQSDQIEYNKLMDLIKNINLNKMEPWRPDLNIRRPPKVFDSTIKKSFEPS